MALVTLSGVISAADLNTNFNDKRATIDTVNDIDVGARSAACKFITYQIRNTREGGTGLTSTTITSTPGFAIKDFTVPDDCLVVGLCLRVINPDATSRTITLTLSAIDVNEVAVSKYLTELSYSISVTATSAATFDGTRAAPSIPMVLVKGITYRLSLTSSSGTAVSSVDGCIIVRQMKRYR